jgi:hypothetical protein
MECQRRWFITADLVWLLPTPECILVHPHDTYAHMEGVVRSVFVVIDSDTAFGKFGCCIILTSLVLSTLGQDTYNSVCPSRHFLPWQKPRHVSNISCDNPIHSAPSPLWHYNDVETVADEALCIIFGVSVSRGYQTHNSFVTRFVFATLLPGSLTSIYMFHRYPYNAIHAETIIHMLY